MRRHSVCGCHRPCQFDRLAINVIVENVNGDISSCDIPYSDDLQQFNHDYQMLTAQVASECKSTFLEDHMIIGTSTLVQTEIDCIVNQMDGGHAAKFLQRLQNEINKI